MHSGPHPSTQGLAPQVGQDTSQEEEKMKNSQRQSQTQVDGNWLFLRLTAGGRGETGGCESEGRTGEGRGGERGREIRYSVYYSTLSEQYSVYYSTLYLLVQRNTMRATQLMKEAAQPREVMTVRAMRWRTGRGCNSCNWTQKSMYQQGELVSANAFFSSI